MEVKNSRYNLFGTIDCEVNHPEFGWIPFTADPEDIEPHGRALFAEVKNLAAPYVAPE